MVFHMRFFNVRHGEKPPSKKKTRSIPWRSFGDPGLARYLYWDHVTSTWTISPKPELMELGRSEELYQLNISKMLFLLGVYYSPREEAHVLFHAIADLWK
jgi:hypothetical protein